jgi:arylamine N-acetyltransferase
MRLYEAENPESRLRLPNAVFSDHVQFGAGGTCFSLTYFFWKILLKAGFNLYPVFCDRSYGPDTHCALVVFIGGEKYLVDPGYLMEEPLLIPPFGETFQRSDAFSVILTRLGLTSQFILSTVSRGVKKLRYRLKDFEISHDIFIQRWSESFDWAMMRHPCVSKLTGSGQLFMRDGVLRKAGEKSNEQGSIKKKFAEEIEKTFGISGSLAEGACDAIHAVFGRKPI